MKIVVVDDDPVARLLVEVTLTSLGHEVTACSDALSAWNAVQDKGATVVVSDWMMPGMDGLELCRRLRRRDNGRVYFILVSSVLNTPQQESQAVNAGVDDLIPKPVLPDELGEHLRRAELAIAC